MLFLQFILYFSSFVGTIENNIPGAALEPCQLEIKQLSPGILKFRTEHKDNPFTLNCSMVPRTFLFIFHAGSRRLDSNNFRNSNYEKKSRPVRPTFAEYLSRLSFCFLWLWLDLSCIMSSMFIVILIIRTVKTKCLNNTTLMVKPEGKLP